MLFPNGKMIIFPVWEYFPYFLEFLLAKQDTNRNSQDTCAPNGQEGINTTLPFIFLVVPPFYTPLCFIQKLSIDYSLEYFYININPKTSESKD